jgi:hypothetical protein
MNEQRREVQAMLAHEPSRRFVRRLLDAAGLFDPTADAGARGIALWVIAELNAADKHAFPSLLTEAANETVGEQE